MGEMKSGRSKKIYGMMGITRPDKIMGTNSNNPNGGDSGQGHLCRQELLRQEERAHQERLTLEEDLAQQQGPFGHEEECRGSRRMDLDQVQEDIFQEQASLLRREQGLDRCEELLRQEEDLKRRQEQLLWK